jgi:hypothetical protein
MVTLELKKEKSSKEMMADGGGTIPFGWNVMSGKINEDETFDIMSSGVKLYFSFSKGNRRIILDLTSTIMDAYRLAMED